MLSLLVWKVKSIEGDTVELIEVLTTDIEPRNWRKGPTACLLTDEERIQAWDFERTYYAMPSYLRGNGTGVCELLGNTTITSLDNLSTDVLVSLQGWHDNLYGTPDERKELENIASFYGLVFPSA